MTAQTFNEFHESSIQWLLDHLPALIGPNFTDFGEGHVAYDLFLDGNTFLQSLHFYADGAHFTISSRGVEFQTIQDAALYLCNEHGLRLTSTLSLLNDNTSVQRVGEVKTLDPDHFYKLVQRVKSTRSNFSHFEQGFYSFEGEHFTGWSVQLDYPARFKPGTYLVCLSTGSIHQTTGGNDYDGATGFKLLHQSTTFPSPPKVLCQDCLRVRDYTPARHNVEEVCECGGHFCGCEGCNSTIRLLFQGKRSAKELGTLSDLSYWSAEYGISQQVQS